MPEDAPAPDYGRMATMYGGAGSPVGMPPNGAGLGNNMLLMGGLGSNAPSVSGPQAAAPMPHHAVHNEPEEKSGPGDGRRSRQHRRGGDKAGGDRGGDRGSAGSGADGASVGNQASVSSGAVGREPRRNNQEGGGAKDSRHGGGGAAAFRYGASAGTGGSEEGPPPPSRHRVHRDDHDEEAVGPPRGGKAKNRQPGLGMAAAPTRRSPDLIAPWESMDLQHGALPSIYSGFGQGAGQGLGLQEGSRAPSRLNAGTPTPREEDSLDLAARQMHVGGPPLASRWPGGGPAGLGPAGSDWGLGLGLGAGDALGPVRQPPDGRQTPLDLNRNRRGLGSYHGH